MKELIHIKKLQMKINNANKHKNYLNDLVNYETVIKEISELRIAEDKQRVRLQTANAEIKMLTDKNSYLKETIENHMITIKNLEDSLTVKEKEVSELNKSH